MAKYDAAFWRRVLGRAQPTSLMGTLRRIVENQEQKVTVPLVDNLAEHEVLEELLEDSKPDGAQDALARFDYLLRTPWRYPPLPWGSRFGRRFEPSLFYGAQNDSALFAEAAYYRLVFLEGMQTPFRERVISQHTIFEARYQTEDGCDLCQPPFAKHEAVLRDKARYLPCQELGSELRARGTAAIKYYSARSLEQDSCIALFSPVALKSRKHLNPRAGICETSVEGVSFRVSGELHRLEREQFLEDGVFPLPAG